MKIQNFEKNIPLAIYNKRILLKFEGSTLKDVARRSATNFSGHIGRHFEFLSNFQKCEKIFLESHP